MACQVAGHFLFLRFAHYRYAKLIEKIDGQGHDSERKDIGCGGNYRRYDQYNHYCMAAVTFHES